MERDKKENGGEKRGKEREKRGMGEEGNERRGGIEGRRRGKEERIGNGRVKTKTGGKKRE